MIKLNCSTIRKYKDKINEKVLLSSLTSSIILVVI